MPHEEYERRLAQARRRAQWELGDPDWANVILGAFSAPDADNQLLKEEKA